jgi:hypothetical protein
MQPAGNRTGAQLNRCAAASRPTSRRGIRRVPGALALRSLRVAHAIFNIPREIEPLEIFGRNIIPTGADP